MATQLRKISAVSRQYLHWKQNRARKDVDYDLPVDSKPVLSGPPMHGKIVILFFRM
jgi:hypothetical protein